MPRNSKIDHFISQVCSQIKCKEVHGEITMELSNHIENLTELYREAGITEKEAIEKALKQMGDPLQVGMQLHQIHKPKTEWGLLVTVIGFALFAMFVMFSLISGFDRYPKEFAYLPDGLLNSKALYSILAIAIGTLMFFMDYRRFSSYFRWIYAVTVLGMFLLRTSGTIVSGRHMLKLPFTVIDFLSVSPYLLLIGLAGFVVNWDWNQKRNLIKAFIAFVIPDFLFWVNGSMHFFTLWVVFLVLVSLVKAKNLRKAVLVLSTTAMTAVFAYLWSRPSYIHDKLWAFLKEDGTFMTYQTKRSIESIKSAGWLGHGFGSWPEQVPGIESELIFTYVVYAFGWIVGALLLLSIIFFFARLTKISILIQDPFGRIYIKGIVALFALQFFMNIFAALGLFPFLEYTLPFISHGGSQLVVQMMMIGLALSVYRRKDMLPKSSVGA